MKSITISLAYSDNVFSIEHDYYNKYTKSLHIISFVKVPLLFNKNELY